MTIGGVEEFDGLEARWRLSHVTWSLVWLGIVGAGLTMWSSWTSVSWAALMSPLVVLGGLAGLAVLWSHRGYPSRRFEDVTMVVAGLAAALGQGVQIAAEHWYSTDAAAFNQIAARALVHAHNPYTTSMQSASGLFAGATHYWTYTLTGGHVVAYSYPAGSLWLQAPISWLHMSTDWLDLAAWLATGIILYFALPRSLRFVAGVLLLNGIFLTRLGNGGTDAVFMPFLVLAAWRWDRFSDVTLSRFGRYLGPVALGLACSIKQSPWFCVPFFVAGVAIEAHERGMSWRKTGARYAGVIAFVFGVVNAPFIIMDAAAWWHGTLLPILAPLVPDGSGLVSLALHGVVRGASVHLLWLAGIGAWASLVVGYGLWYKRLKASWMFFVPIVLFIPGRSLSSYLVDFFPAALVGAVSVSRVQRVHLTNLAQRWRIAVVALPIVVTLGLAAAAMTSPVLDVSLIGWTTGAQRTDVGSVLVTLTNTTDARVVAHCEVVSGNTHTIGFWVNKQGSNAITLGAHHSVTLRLYPTVVAAAPSPGQLLLVEAMTTKPAAVSTSAPVRWQVLGS